MAETEEPWGLGEEDELSPRYQPKTEDITDKTNMKDDESDPKRHQKCRRKRMRIQDLESPVDDMDMLSSKLSAPYKCNQCAFATPDFMNFITHKNGHAAEKAKNKSLFTCGMCPFSTPSPADMAVHIQNHISNKPLISIDGSMLGKLSNSATPVENLSIDDAQAKSSEDKAKPITGSIEIVKESNGKHDKSHKFTKSAAMDTISEVVNNDIPKEAARGRVDSSESDGHSSVEVGELSVKKSEKTYSKCLTTTVSTLPTEIVTDGRKHNESVFEPSQHTSEKHSQSSTNQLRAISPVAKEPTSESICGSEDSVASMESIASDALIGYLELRRVRRVLSPKPSTAVLPELKRESPKIPLEANTEEKAKIPPVQNSSHKKASQKHVVYKYSHKNNVHVKFHTDKGKVVATACQGKVIEPRIDEIETAERTEDCTLSGPKSLEQSGEFQINLRTRRSDGAVQSQSSNNNVNQKATASGVAGRKLRSKGLAKEGNELPINSFAVTSRATAEEKGNLECMKENHVQSVEPVQRPKQNNAEFALKDMAMKGKTRGLRTAKALIDNIKDTATESNVLNFSDLKGTQENAEQNTEIVQSHLNELPNTVSKPPAKKPGSRKSKRIRKSTQNIDKEAPNVNNPPFTTSGDPPHKSDGKPVTPIPDSLKSDIESEAIAVLAPIDPPSVNNSHEQNCQKPVEGAVKEIQRSLSTYNDNVELITESSSITSSNENHELGKLLPNTRNLAARFSAYKKPKKDILLRYQNEMSSGKLAEPVVEKLVEETADADMAEEVACDKIVDLVTGSCKAVVAFKSGNTAAGIKDDNVKVLVTDTIKAAFTGSPCQIILSRCTDPVDLPTPKTLATKLKTSLQDCWKKMNQSKGSPKLAKNKNGGAVRNAFLRPPLKRKETGNETETPAKRAMHSTAVENNQHSTTTSLTKVYRCEFCDFSTSKTAELFTHTNQMHSEEEKMYICEKCDYLTSRQSKLAAHMKIHEQQILEEEEKKKKERLLKSNVNSEIATNCVDKTPEITPINQILPLGAVANPVAANMNHVDKNKNEESLKADSNGSPNSTNELYNRPYGCKICPYRASKLYNLQIHERGHNGTIRPYKCKYCPYAAARWKFYVEHQYQHLDVSPRLTCYLCDFKSPDASSLKSHRLSMHKTLPTPLQCDRCNAEFQRKDTLEKHYRSHFSAAGIPKGGRVEAPDDRPFKCVLCDFRAKIPSQLKKHMPTHAKKSVIYRCHKCDYTTRYQCMLTKHRSYSKGCELPELI